MLKLASIVWESTPGSTQQTATSSSLVRLSKLLLLLFLLLFFAFTDSYFSLWFN